MALLSKRREIKLGLGSHWRRVTCLRCFILDLVFETAARPMARSKIRSTGRVTDEEHQHGLDNRGSDRVSSTATARKPARGRQHSNPTNRHIGRPAIIGGTCCLYPSRTKEVIKSRQGLVGTLPLRKCL